MGLFEIISAIVLIVACVFIVIVVLISDTKSGMSQAISGASSDSFYQKNSGRTKEAKLNRAMVASTIIFFVLALLVNVINVNINKIKTNENSDTTSNPALDTSLAEGSGADDTDIQITLEAGGADADEPVQSAPEAATAEAEQSATSTADDAAEPTADAGDNADNTAEPANTTNEG